MDYITIGKIIGTHGIKGEVKVDPLTDNINRFVDLDKVYIGKSNLELSINNMRFFKKGILLRFNGYENINDVLQFKDEYLKVKFEDKIELDEDKYFIFELLDMKVYDIKNNYVGIIVDIIQGASNDVYVIDSGKEEILIPAVKEFIKKVDTENNEMIISPIEGMIP